MSNLILQNTGGKAVPRAGEGAPSCTGKRRCGCLAHGSLQPLATPECPRSASEGVLNLVSQNAGMTVTGAISKQLWQT